MNKKVSITQIELKNYYPFGMVMGQNIEGDSRYGYQGENAEEEELGATHSFEVRLWDARIGRWLSVDPLVGETGQAYIGMGNNPINRIDPDGALDEPVYGSDGIYRGDTKEGFTGEVIIYDGDVDFSKMSASDLLSIKGADTYDNQRGSLSGDAKSNIWTHIVSQLEGQQIYDETFSMSSIEGSKIYHDASDEGSWNSRPTSKYKGWNDRITGTDRYSYKTTVENIQSSIIVHEWYSHIKKGQGIFSYLKSHRLAYKNVINFKSLWNNTTDGYKGFNMRRLFDDTEIETRRTKVDPLYRNLYNKYHKIYD